MAHRCQQTYTTGYDYEMHNHYLNFKRERDLYSASSTGRSGSNPSTAE